MWQWDPSGFFDAGKYWLKEADAGLTPGTLRVHDKTSFFVCVQPGLMVLAAVLTGICGLLTFVMAVRRWWPRGWGALLILAGLSGLGLAAVTPQWRFDADRSRRERLEKTRHQEGIIIRSADLAEQHTQSLFEALVMHRRPIPDPPALAAAFSRDPIWLDKTTRTPAGIAEWAAADHALSLKERRTTERAKGQVICLKWTGRTACATARTGRALRC